MAAKVVGLQWRVHIRVELELATGPNRAQATRGTHRCTWRGLGRTETTTPTTCYGGRSKRGRGEGYGLREQLREVGDEREAHQERDGGARGLGEGAYLPEFGADPAGAEDEGVDVALDV